MAEGSPLTLQVLHLRGAASPPPVGGVWRAESDSLLGRGGAVPAGARLSGGVMRAPWGGVKGGCYLEGLDFASGRSSAAGPSRRETEMEDEGN